jgi:hypothetical protein
MEQDAIITKTGNKARVIYAEDGRYINLDDGDLYFGNELTII